MIPVPVAAEKNTNIAVEDKSPEDFLIISKYYWYIKMAVFSTAIFMYLYLLFLITACAAARRATGTRNGEQDT